MKENDMVGKDLWDNSWTDSIKYQGIERYLAINKKLDLLFKKYLQKGNKKILEIGCAKAKKLIYFAKEFYYDIYGIDYSENGVESATENLRRAGVKGTILCEDIFETSLEENSFDIVYSMGLIEHFEDPTDIIDAHIKLVKKGGIVIITIPNYNINSIYFHLSRIVGIDKKLLDTHNVDLMIKKNMINILKKKNLKILMIDYFGPIDFSLIFTKIKVKPILYLSHAINQLIGYSSFFMKNSEYFSPYLVIIAKENDLPK
jgi:2-polyprenyl-3-methyl-5-hydroxy-6-metoxy-1,4-benzoquinol methylase